MLSKTKIQEDKLFSFDDFHDFIFANCIRTSFDRETYCHQIKCNVLHGTVFAMFEWSDFIRKIAFVWNEGILHLEWRASAQFDKVKWENTGKVARFPSEKCNWMKGRLAGLECDHKFQLKMRGRCDETARFRWVHFWRADEYVLYIHICHRGLQTFAVKNIYRKRKKVQQKLMWDRPIDPACIEEWCKNSLPKVQRLCANVQSIDFAELENLHWFRWKCSATAMRRNAISKFSPATLRIWG